MSGSGAKLFAGIFAAGGLGYMFFGPSKESGLVRAQSDAGARNKKLIRRHSSGDHAFLPNKQDRHAIKESKKNFGVPGHLIQDSEGSRLPTTRGF